MATRRIVLLLFLLLATAACSSAGRSAGSTERSDPNRISVAEIDAARHSDALDMVSALRPRWLRERTTSVTQGTERAQVYVDGVHLGGPEVLRQISVSVISEMEFLDGSTATQRYGTNNGGGAILVTTRAR